MKRLLLLLGPWMAIGAAAQGDAPRSAELIYASAGTSRDGVYRVGDECYVDPTTATGLGWTVRVEGDQIEIRAEGQRFKIQSRILNGKPLIPFRDVIKQLGGTSEWKLPSTLQVWGAARFVRIMDGEIAFESSLPSTPRVFALKDPSRTVIDMHGVKLDARTRIELGPGAKVEQHSPDTVRLTYAIEPPQVLPKYNQQPTKWFEYDLSGEPQEVKPDPASGAVVETRDPETTLPDPPPTIPDTAPLAARVARLESIALVRESPTRAELRFKLNAVLLQPARFARPDPSTLEIIFPGVAFQAASELKAASTPSIAQIETLETPEGMTVRLKLARPMGSEIVAAPGEVGLILIKPNVGDGRLAGKIVVVDAGHGGSDSGARSPAKDASEKNMTLAVAKLVSERLQAEGATVIMTRKTDVKIALKERAEIANRNGADLFVSVHINSNRAANTTSGGMTFHHKQDPIGRLLAECVQREIARVSKLPSLGVWSDQRIYQSGFAVLRYSKMPAILIELGFINHSRDRKRMLEKSFQADVAGAIVRGLRVYLGDVKDEE